MKKILLTLFVAGLTFISFAKSNESKNNSEATTSNSVTIQLTGVVTDKLSNEALVGVEIKIEGTNQKVYTDFDGKFTFKNLNPGKYNLVASYISYEKNVIENFDANPSNNLVSIKLETSN
jgi:hypothetical protein